MKYKHIFGPVPSRRLGLSLGVDLVRHKTCSLDCIYCECGPTTNQTLKRKAYVPFDEVKTELADYFENHPDPDYVTFSGSGEPTLNPDIGRIIDFIKEKKAQVRVAVLTNATLLSDPVVRKDLNRADLVMPSLDAVTPQTFEKINRPAGQIDIHKVIDGLKAFAESFQGEIWLEVFILPGINDAKEELEALGKIIRDINPTRVQLNTLDRPGAVAGLKAASKDDLDRVAGIIDADNVEIIARVKDLASREHISDEKMEAMIMETIHRRPCTIDDLTAALNLEKGKLEILMKRLILEHKVESVQQERGIFYQTIKKL
ncbi:radical SAM protein [Desulfobacter postgatei]|uniref:Fe-S oxidoreductase n=1 Tax=Desulfobacter postgatei 2ac9 TaxID=879212 RepID=I5B4R7_9BACT|nr:radical SAM protein [Desulfobacter postgatei]EIM64480.1 Fe-S oxidoreductase [Desulfobacter postgatei 2ac9]